MWLIVAASGTAVAALVAFAIAKRHYPGRAVRNAAIGIGLTGCLTMLAVSWRVSTAAAAPIDVTRAQAGKQLFDSHGCLTCHSVGGGLVFGPDLLYVADKYNRDVLELFMTDADRLYEEFGRRPLSPGNPDMVNLRIPAADASQIAEYLLSLTGDGDRGRARFTGTGDDN